MCCGATRSTASGARTTGSTEPGRSGSNSTGKACRIARCTVERLMRELGIEGARRGGKKRRTTVADPAAQRPRDLVDQHFSPPAPDCLWVADFTYVATWSGTVYVAFVIDAHSRRILGWRAATSMRTERVLDALKQAIWTPARG